ncbi:putative hydro-lyase [Sneathiella chinensis]|uniref:Putative hydro-lyase GCM10007924_02700 n=1 Tax=Sneathiella chinensis TaxID=349750 RepID=A0ABQ5U170_9PROT|nr:putative hydro-lyase [Sneathiella chinensis]GLQ05049.1 UPF0317 protein YcsI [Sneathiella chinensis]
MDTDIRFSDLTEQSVESVREHIRAGRYGGHTAGLSKGQLQCNLAILPADLAEDFLEFCRLNPKPCPLAGYSKPGQPFIERIGASVDIRTDTPLYFIYRNGELAGETRDLTDLWQDDFVAFAIGCSFTFENALVKAGFSLPHIEQNLTVPMFKSSIQTVPSKHFGGSMVVSMRPIPKDRIDEVRTISQGYPLAHGRPVHVGDPAEIGIKDVHSPDWGDAVNIRDGEVPVFWACGVTPQVAIMQAKPEISITHAPGAMLIADVDEQTLPLFPYDDSE